jgi:UDP-N-acetylmuramyl pentapeptide phosphotransferase/UDP-N-acetylglucosamine-1-phosphate transferase
MISAEFSVFGASMSGACIGFLFHNRYRASVVMSRVGSFALGGAVATIASCSGMFLPMLIACSLFFIELLFAILQVRHSVDYFTSMVAILKVLMLHYAVFASVHLLIATLESGPTSLCHPPRLCGP